MFVITGVAKDSNRKMYLVRDSHILSPRSYYWDVSFQKAVIFGSEEKAKEVLGHPDFTEVLKIVDEGIYPPNLFEDVKFEGICIEQVILNKVLLFDGSKVQNEYLTKKEKYISLKKQLDEL